MRKFLVRARMPFLCALLVAVVLAACLGVYPAANARARQDSEGYGGILRLWHIDSFEGGKGSRAAFLRDVAKKYADRTGTFVLVTSHTVESAKAALQKGEPPDLLSCGAEGFAADLALPLDGYDFAPARSGGHTYGYPWCRGEYFLFGKEGTDGTAPGAENTAVAGAGGCAAAYYAGLPAGEYKVAAPAEAYAAFAGGNCAFLVGTQRDYWRLTSREIAFTARPLDGFTDLWQYMYVCAADEAYGAGLSFLAYLLSEEVQAQLPRIGMLSARFAVYADGSALSAAEEALPEHSAYAFLSDAAAEEFSRYAVLALRGDKDGAKKLENFLV